METEKNKGGRPATGKQYPHKVFGYFDDEGLRLLRVLVEKYGSEANTIRQAVKALAAKDGVG